MCTGLYEIQACSTNTMVTSDSTLHKNNYIFHPQKSTALRLQLVCPENDQSSMHAVQGKEQNALYLPWEQNLLLALLRDLCLLSADFMINHRHFAFL